MLASVAGVVTFLDQGMENVTLEVISSKLWSEIIHLNISRKPLILFRSSENAEDIIILGDEILMISRHTVFLDCL
ncbi:unnamed protein product [Acanthoscelides obtectus]|uniref:Uncharacterized protein n=1 Tax=Acanthoscelides obtectus TaxID=200917 RepID=A0A9P0QDX4_ACAOB|nr:unnamed protein product [Acanthoscelides obtectus]CAH2017800.1 unnamed protein product [Acanthoscelides obtectus]CAK1687658.1 hypothetical protein AOBTE_LOCUS36315 [Acanthoscelides obtectus]CAK1687661.1 hypothetical protein AOBTE_LOCUS36316 [Acanthoscelides obtectus]